MVLHMRKLVSSDSFLKEAKEAKHKPNIVLQILIFLAVFFVSQFAVGIIVGISAMIHALSNAPENFNFSNSKALADLITAAGESE